MKYHLDTDNDSHWYIIPVNKMDDWDAFLDIGQESPDDPKGWDVPKWAIPFGGGAQQVSFDSYEFI